MARPRKVIDEKKLVEMAQAGMPDVHMAAALEIDVKTLKRYAPLIRKARADNAFVIAKKVNAKAKKGDLRAAELVLERHGFFEAPLQAEVRVRVVYEDEPPPRRRPSRATGVDPDGDEGS